MEHSHLNSSYRIILQIPNLFHITEAAMAQKVSVFGALILSRAVKSTTFERSGPSQHLYSALPRL